MRSYKGFDNSTNTWSPVYINDYREDVVYDPNGNILNYHRNGAPEISSPEAMDDLTYHYYAGNNQLKRVNDAVSSGNYTADIDDQQEEENYVYDAIGNLIEDKSDTLAITWNVYGKIRSIVKNDGTITYTYDAAGNRVAKHYNGKTTIYVRDASGNVLSVYEKETAGAIEQVEVHLYGSSRLGMTTKKTGLDSLDIELEGGYGTAKELTFTRGEKLFELSNHLGNVLVTVSDRRIAVDDDEDGEIDWYEADVVTANDYYPFGMLMPGRKYAASELYRYGFNGQERSTEIELNGNSMTAEFWQYDARLGRRWNVDPKPNISMSPYCVLANTPIQFQDIRGDTLRVNTVNRNSQADLLSIVKNENRKHINVSMLGLVTYDKAKYDNLTPEEKIRLKADKGFMLIKDMIDLDKNFWFSSTTRVRYEEIDINTNTSRIVDADLAKMVPVGAKLDNNPNFGISGIPLYVTFTNLSFTPRGDEQQMGIAQKPSKQEQIGTLNGTFTRKYDGELYLVPGEHYYEHPISKAIIKIPRPSMVYHELMENYLRVRGSNYADAHEGAKVMEGSTFGNYGRGGASYFIMGASKY